MKQIVFYVFAIFVGVIAYGSDALYRCSLRGDMVVRIGGGHGFRAMMADIYYISNDLHGVDLPFRIRLVSPGSSNAYEKILFTAKNTNTYSFVGQRLLASNMIDYRQLNAEAIDGSLPSLFKSSMDKGCGLIDLPIRNSWYGQGLVDCGISPLATNNYDSVNGEASGMDIPWPWAQAGKRMGNKIARPMKDNRNVLERWFCDSAELLISSALYYDEEELEIPFYIWRNDDKHEFLNALSSGKAIMRNEGGQLEVVDIKCADLDVNADMKVSHRRIRLTGRLVNDIKMTIHYKGRVASMQYSNLPYK